MIIPCISLVANVSLATFERGERCFDTVSLQLIHPALPVLAHLSPVEAGHCIFAASTSCFYFSSPPIRNTQPMAKITHLHFPECALQLLSLLAIYS
jgi:hypothetical protein